MARSLLRHTVTDRAGNALVNALVNVYLKGTTTPVSDMFTGEVGGSAVTTITTNAQGEVVAWFDTPKLVDLLITDNGDTAFRAGETATITFTPYTETVVVLPSPDTANEYVNVLQYGAVGDGVANDTTAVTNAAAAVGVGEVLFFPGGLTFLVNPGITLADDRTVLAWGATLKRRANGPAALLTVGADCAVYGLTLDGNMAVLGASTAAERGLVCGARPLLVDVESFDNYGQNVRAAATAGSSPGGLMLRVRSHDGGQNPGVSGTSDGIYLQNINHLTLDSCVIEDNARSGIAATTSTPLATDSEGIRLVNCRVSGSGYNDVNLEYVSEAEALNLHADGLVTFANSPRCVFTNVICNDIRGDAADRPHINGAYLTDTNEALYLTGASPIVSNVTCNPSGAATGNMVVVQPSNDMATLQGIRIVSCANGFLLDVGTGFYASDLHVETSTNTRYKWNHSGGQSASQARTVTIENGLASLPSTAAPTTDVWQRGDRVINTTPSAGGPYGWVCVTAGTPGTWRPISFAGGSGGTVTALADADTTPSVANGTNFLTANTGATSITTFDDGYNGQVVTLTAGDANTTLVNGATLVLADGANFLPSTGDAITLQYNGTLWREISRASRPGVLQSATVATSETTTSTSFTNLATVGPAVSVTVRRSGLVLVSLCASIQNNTAGQRARMSFALSGANTAVAADVDGIDLQSATGGQDAQLGRTRLLTGLTPGLTTITAKYLVSGGTGTFARRELIAEAK